MDEANLGPQASLLTVAEAARLAGLTPGALRHHVHRGRLPVVRLGRAWRIRLVDLVDLLTPCRLGVEAE